MHGLEHGHFAGVQVGGGCQPEPTLQGRTQIGDDVPEHVARDNDLEHVRLAHQLHYQRIHVEMVLLNVRILGAHLFEHPRPQVMPVAQRIALVAHADPPQPLLAGELERVADDALHALACVDVLLDRHLVGSTELEVSAHARIQPLGILAKYGEVELRYALQRAQPLVQQLHRPVIDVEVQTEARAQEDVDSVPHVRNARIAEGSHEHRVQGAELLQRLVRQGLACLQVMVRAVGKLLHVESGQSRGLHRLEHFQRLPGHLRADAVAAHHANAVSLHLTLPLNVIKSNDSTDAVAAVAGLRPCAAWKPSSR